jgi:hypothetical protein
MVVRGRQDAIDDADPVEPDHHPNPETSGATRVVLVTDPVQLTYSDG